MPNKSPTDASFVQLNFPRKVIYMMLAVICVVIGIAGLLIPIIPGILFLIGAVYLLSQVSSRVHRWSEGQTWMSNARVRMIQLGGLRPLEKTRFLLLLGAKNIVAGLQRMTESIQRITRKA